MRRRLALLTLLVPFAIPASAGAVAGTYFPGEPVDGPSADVQTLGDLRVARDGSGAMTWVRKDGGVDHIFVSRLVDGAFLAPERVDGGLDNAGSQPVISVGDGGKVVVAFVSGGAVYTVNRGAGAPGLRRAAADLRARASTRRCRPSINGTSYLAYTAAGDVHVARMDRKSATSPASTACSTSTRPPTRATATGARASPSPPTASPPWSGASRATRTPAASSRAGSRWRPSRSPTAPSCPTSTPRTTPATPGPSRARPPTVTSSRAAWSARPSTTRSSSTAAPPRPAPNIDISGKGVGYAAMGTSTGSGAFGAVLKDDKFNPATYLGGAGADTFPDAATAENGDGLIAFEQGDPSGRAVHAPPYDYVATTRAVTQPAPDVLLSKPELGQTDASRGLRAAADRAGDVVVAFVQGEGAARQVVAATFDRAPARSPATYVVEAALSRYRGREEHRIGKGGQLDESLCVLAFEEMGHFQAYREIELSLGFERLLEVGCVKLPGGHEQLGTVDPRPVVPAQVFHAVLPEDSKPGAEAAADIDDAPAGSFSRASGTVTRADSVESRSQSS